MVAIAQRVASSEYQAIADDALKDEDNGIWLTCLAPAAHQDWFQRFYWIRWVDRLAEQEQLVKPGGGQFAAFCRAWHGLRDRGLLTATDAQQWPVLRDIQQCWFTVQGQPRSQAEIAAWDGYLQAMTTYHQPHLTLKTLAGYERMLIDLAGSCFQLLPQLRDSQRQAAGDFGMVDQFYNNLRDLYEDTRRGVCYFPADLLDQFDLVTEEILDLSCLHKANYHRLMQFWVENYLQRLKQRLLPLLLSPNLDPAWRYLVAWFLHRYQRVERVMRACHYDFVAFAHRYWEAVHQDLQWQRSLGLEAFRAQLEQSYQVAELASFLNVRPQVLAPLKTAPRPVNGSQRSAVPRRIVQSLPICNRRDRPKVAVNNRPKHDEACPR